MKILIVDDDLTNRVILEKLLLPYGKVHSANDGADAIDFFKLALDQNNPYNLICLDIMMPNKDGHETLKDIRRLEKEANIFGKKSVNIIMTTALSDGGNVLKAFKEQCEAYLVKPIEKKKLVETLNNLGLI